MGSLVTSDQAALVKKLNHTNHNSNSSEKNKMTNFSIAAIMNNERGSSGLVRPSPASETKLGNYSKSSFAPHMSPKAETSFENDDEVDVEQWSDSEDTKPHPARPPFSVFSKTFLVPFQHTTLTYVVTTTIF